MENIVDKIQMRYEIKRQRNAMFYGLVVILRKSGKYWKKIIDDYNFSTKHLNPLLKCHIEIGITKVFYNL